MARRRPDHSQDMQRTDRRRLNSRRRRRRVARALVRTVFWSIVLAGVFVLGLGYGRTLSGDDEATSRRATVSTDLGTVEATLPTRTITVTTTTTVPSKRATRGR